ncbi:MAG TPA: 6-phosphogluconolactonase [Chlamydiales bacterium]|nr:6-phosphogluconolactonase [Chlamydiales bacterium]
MLEYDQRRNLFIGKTEDEALLFAVDHWVNTARKAIQQRGKFFVALSGGSTPIAIYQRLSKVRDLDWNQVFLFWSDERAVPPDHPESNYGNAMKFFSTLPIPEHQIFRMKAEVDLEKNALDYEEKIRHYTGKHLFDHVMLGIGEDGHTASLFPNTQAISITDRLVVANHVPQKNTDRMTFTFPCINESANITIYALGKSKQEVIPKILKAPIVSEYPASKIGTPQSPALWVLDDISSRNLSFVE